jgi:hypothetical protein
MPGMSGLDVIKVVNRTGCGDHPAHRSWFDGIRHRSAAQPYLLDYLLKARLSTQILESVARTQSAGARMQSMENQDGEAGADENGH